MSRPVSLLLRFLAIAAFGTFAVAMIAVAFLPEVSKLPESVSFQSPAKLALPALPESSKIVTEAGEPMGQLLGAENREIVPDRPGVRGDAQDPPRGRGLRLLRPRRRQCEVGLPGAAGQQRGR